jgi:hypothetical protein
MADVSISQLTQGTPASNSIVPYSTGSNTLGVPVSAIFQNTNTYVAIGSAISAQYKLDVYHDNFNAIRAVGNNTNSIGIYIDNKAPGARAYGIGSVGSTGPSKAGNLTIFDHTAQLPRFNIDSSGNVGIGVNDPLSKLHVNGIVTATGLYAPGCVIQVLQAFKSDTFTTQALIANGGEGIPGLSVTITPKSLSSKILVSFSVTCAGVENITQVFFRLRRGSTEIGNAESVGGRTPVMARDYAFNNNCTSNVSFQYLDSPNTTSAITYQLYTGTEGNNGTIFINRTHNDQANTTYGARGVSTFTVMEIAG